MSRLAKAQPAAKKKGLVASERDPKKRKAFRKKVAKLDVKKYIFIDEMGSNLGFTRLYGRAEPGQRVIESVGARVEFLPTYSPDMNPIENCWSKVKSILRSIKPRSPEELLDALEKAFASITQQDILGWFTHCGYQAALE